MTKENINKIALQIGITAEVFMQDCINGSIFVFNVETLKDFWKEAELETPFMEWVQHEINSRQLFTLDNTYFFMTA